MQRLEHLRMPGSARPRPTVFGSVGVALDPVTHVVCVTNVEDTSVSSIDTRRCNGTDASGCARASTPLPTDDYPDGIAVDPARRNRLRHEPRPGDSVDDPVATARSVITARVRSRLRRDAPESRLIDAISGREPR